MTFPTSRECILLIGALCCATTCKSAEPSGATLVDHPIASGFAPVYLDGNEWSATNIPTSSPQYTYVQHDNLIPSDRNNFTKTLSGFEVCQTVCSMDQNCVGFTMDSSRTECWLYNFVTNLTTVGAQGDVYFSKSKVTKPPSPPVPPVTITATVPGDVLTDLQRANVTGDPYFNSTWRDPEYIQKWNAGVWEYTKTFATPPPASHKNLLLVFDGIKMGAVIDLNGKWLGNATDQFIRYVFPLSPADLLPTTNILKVTFGAELNIDTGGRFTHSTDIDWAPTMVTKDPITCTEDGCRSTFGFGIWKSVYLLPLQTVAITQLVPHTFYAGPHPTSILSDNDHAGFMIKVRVQFYSTTAGATGTISVLGSWTGATMASIQVTSVQVGTNNVTLTIPPAQTQRVNLWHPHGHGGQPLYNITATFSPSTEGGAPLADTTASTTRRIGFRHIALITINDTDPTQHGKQAQTNGTGQFTMFFRVNGAAVYARGGNKVPMDLLDGRMSADATHRLVQSAVEANMNTIRVWGGGIWEPRAFFDACDELGVLLYTDMQFTWAFIMGTPQERAEIEYQTQRLSHHPSIAIWDGCNECGGAGLYQNFVMPTVAKMDQSRPIWPSCPAPGWESGVDSLTSRPNGETLITGAGGSPRQPFPFPQESHGPYTAFMKSSMEDVVMGKAQPQIPFPAERNDPTLTPALTGPQYEGWYKSEFGCVAWSSFESMSAQMPKDQWSMSSTGAKNRNWNASNVINAFFGNQSAINMGRFGESAFKKQLYQSMIGQALFLKTEIESWRSQNVFGTTIWMYNEMWPTAGWGSIEYGSPVPGQVMGGRWKPLHYIFKSSTFADQLSTCNTGGACMVTNDSPFAFKGNVNVTLSNLQTGGSTLMVLEPVNLEPGAGITHWFCAQPPATTAKFAPEINQSREKSKASPECAPWNSTKAWRLLSCEGVGANCVLDITVVDGNDKEASHNVLPFVPPKDMQLANATVTISVDTKATPYPVITVASTATALFTVLTTQAAGRFSDNAFIVYAASPIEISFVPWETFDASAAELLASTIRVEHLYENL
eukprot:m.133582 g.133582  ORF g.133582 m.133582 type:complete len:1057 (-) comp29683_c0_seq3:38-3208(-)